MTLRKLRLLPALLLAAAALGAAGPAHAGNPCPDQPTHTYSSAALAEVETRVVHWYGPYQGKVYVRDTNTTECDGNPNTVADWDGDLDAGLGGGFFGYGAWAEEPDCLYKLNVHGPNVVVRDVTWLEAVWFVVGENDQAGPVKVADPVWGDIHCETDNVLNPCTDNDPAQCDAGDDPDDCISAPFFGRGITCGSGGGDGGYWVFLIGVSTYADETRVDLGNHPTFGTITAY